VTTRNGRYLFLTVRLGFAYGYGEEKGVTGGLYGFTGRIRASRVKSYCVREIRIESSSTSSSPCFDI